MFKKTADLVLGGTPYQAGGLGGTDGVGLIYGSDLVPQKPFCLPTGIIPTKPGPSKLFVNINVDNISNCHKLLPALQPNFLIQQADF